MYYKRSQESCSLSQTQFNSLMRDSFNPWTDDIQISVIDKCKQLSIDLVIHRSEPHFLFQCPGKPSMSQCLLLVISFWYLLFLVNLGLFKKNCDGPRLRVDPVPQHCIILKHLPGQIDLKIFWCNTILSGLKGINLSCVVKHKIPTSLRKYV